MCPVSQIASDFVSEQSDKVCRTFIQTWNQSLRDRVRRSTKQRSLLQFSNSTNSIYILPPGPSVRRLDAPFPSSNTPPPSTCTPPPAADSTRSQRMSQGSSIFRSINQLIAVDDVLHNNPINQIQRSPLLAQRNAQHIPTQSQPLTSTIAASSLLSRFVPCCIMQALHTVSLLR